MNQVVSNPTELVYYDSHLLTLHNATVLRILPREDNIFSIFLDKTIFYPQGGGQP